jgi:DNA-binding transcriptional MerR regulator
MPYAHTHGATSANGRAMPAETTRHVSSSGTLAVETTETAKKETWQDWWPEETVAPEALLTRQEVVDRLRSEGVDVTVFDLTNWEKRGITPRPTRQRTGRTTHAMYHPQELDVIRTLRELQAEGKPLSEIRPELRGRFPRRLRGSAHIRIQSNATATGTVRVPTATATAEAHAPTVATLPEDLMAHLRTFAHHHGEDVDSEIVRIELRLINADGHTLTIPVDVQQDAQSF